MIKLMLNYNALCKRFSKAEEYFSREDVSLIEKQNQAGNTKKLFDDMQSTIDAIEAEGYKVSEEEWRVGFTQVQFLSDKGLIR